jgi:hypothetical protein
MAEIDWVTCKIALGGDLRSIVFKSEFEPVTVPEIEIIAAIHGDASVSDVEYLKTEETTPGEEKNRLISIYPETVVSGIYPGRNPNMNMVFSGARTQKAVNAPAKKQRPSTKVTAAKPFIPPSEDDGNED